MQLSRLSRDLLDLEEDFKYNLSLLKTKEAEIERCSNVNKLLEQTLKLKMNETKEVRDELAMVKEAFEECQKKTKKEKELYKETVEKLTNQLGEVTHKFQKRFETLSVDHGRKEEELQKCYSSSLCQKEETYLSNLRVIEERIEEKEHETSKIKAQFQNVNDENSLLNEKIKHLETELHVYKSDFASLQSSNNKLNAEILCWKSNCVSLENRFHQIKLDNENLNESLRNRKENFKTVIQENEDFKQKIVENEKLTRDLNFNNDLLVNKNKELERKINNMKGILDGDHCNITSHSNHDSILQQNVILKNLVKEMRKEREKFNTRHEIVELKVKKVENLTKLLKFRVFQNMENDISATINP